MRILPFLTLVACAAGHAPPTPAQLVQGLDERAGLVLEKDVYGDSASRLVYLDQGWNPVETLWFYHADQGSTLLPYDTLVRLEQADNAAPFLAPEHLARYRFLNQRASPGNPDALPIGMARHGDDVGLTCAACHTAQINYKGTAVRIDGAPGLLDTPGLTRALQASIEATLADPTKLGRFAAVFPGGEKERLEAARASLTESLAWFQSYATANHSTTTEGFGRIDAIGRILNQAIRFSSGPEHSLETNAPASYPLLWDAPRHDFVQWTGFSPNAGAGALARNMGEVIGVYGRVDVQHYETEEEARKGYPSTIQADDLVAMEASLRKLQSPVWPSAILGTPDARQVKAGEALYAANCVSCHALLDRDDPRRQVVAQMIAIDTVGTDDTSARNLVDAKAPAGILKGAIAPDGTRHGDTVTGLGLLGDLVARTAVTRPVAVVRAITDAKLAGLEESEKQGDYRRNTDAEPNAEILAYKARPLNGTWASSPYLHNGSVPSLYDLLLPVAERPVTFSVGRLEYDPKRVGYVSEGAVPFLLDTRLKGNSNRGHTYGTTLTEEERWALVEYLKTL